MSTSLSSLKVAPAAEPSPEGVPAWKRELNERLAAARRNRAQKPEQQSLLPEIEKKMSVKEESRAARLAAKVAAQYAAAPSYSEMLAVEARAAAAAAEVAMAVAQNAHAAAQALLADLEKPREEAGAYVAQPQSAARSHAPASESDSPYIVPDITPGGPAGHAGIEDPVVESDPGAGHAMSVNLVEQEMVFPSQPLPVNLIEFPRELVAARRARPRLAEGPLRESPEETAHDQAQLRIFEVEHESISTAVKIDSAPPVWSTIRLDAKPATMPTDEGERPFSLELSLKTAPLEDRLMAGIFDIGLVLLAFVLFVLVFAACTAHPPTGKAAISATVLVLIGLFVLYQYLCFRFTDGTPGMRYARIALCTFENENPSRKAMRRRIPYLLLAAAPLGLGLAWAWFDVDRLGWHDRMTRMYQRSYR